MKTNILNWYRLNNWSELTIQYQLIDVVIEGNDNNSSEFNRGFFNALNFLAYETKGAVSAISYQGKRHIAVRADFNLEKRTIPGTPLDVVLTPLNKTFTLKINEIKDNELEMAIRFIESSIDFQLGQNRNLWGAGSNVYLNKIPLSTRINTNTDIYHGFKFKIVAEDRKNVFICIDLAYKYVDKINLHEALKNVTAERKSDFVSGHNFLYQNGDSWYIVKGKSIGVPISVQNIDLENFQGTVFDYISKHGRYSTSKYQPHLHEESATFWHTYSNKSAQPVTGAACLAKALHNADNGLHKMSINNPATRFSRIEYHVNKHFKGLTFHGQKITIDNTPHRKTCEIFELPALKYGKNAVLDPYAPGEKYSSSIIQFPKRRREYVYKNGIINESAFANQYLLVPEDMPYSMAKSIKNYMDKSIKLIAPNFPGFDIHQYSIKSSPYASNVCKDIKALIKQKQLEGGTALFILPETKDGGRFNKFLHKLVKKELFNSIKLKCISYHKLNKFLKPVLTNNAKHIYEVPEILMRDFRSYQTNIIFEYLIVNKRWPYALAKNLNYDIYIGVDAHDFFAGFTFFFKNGEKIVFDIEQIAKNTGSFRSEKINYKVIQEKIVKVLSRHLKLTQDHPKSIIILRDGVSFGEEEKALKGAIDQLGDEGLLDKKNVQLGIVDVAKTSSIPVRMAHFSGPNKVLENPNCGSHFYLSNKQAFVFNTGFPYKVPGSSKPLQLNLSFGDIDFQKVVEDIFQLTQITFSSPDRPTSLPLPLKLIDTLIRDVAHEFTYTNIQEREVKIIEPSLN